MNKTGKKTFTTGIDALLTPVPEEKKSTARQPDANEDIVSITCRLPLSLKIQMEHHCADKRVKQQELIINAIRKYLE